MNLNAAPDFKGETFDPAKDQARLETQYARVLRAAKSAEWFTLGLMSARTGAPEASVSARLRDFRRAGYTVERRRVPGEAGLWEYRLMLQRELPL